MPCAAPRQLSGETLALAHRVSRPIPTPLSSAVSNHSTSFETAYIASTKSYAPSSIFRLEISAEADVVMEVDVELEDEVANKPSSSSRKMESY